MGDFIFNSLVGRQMQTFDARVNSRSTRHMAGPPGETEVLQLNPRRRELILRATNWTTIFPGSLNLEVDESAVRNLLQLAPVIREEGADVKYPAPYTKIPILRGAYLYFTARLRSGDRTAAALIRRAVNPLPTRLEAFSDQPLRLVLALADGDTVTCEVEGNAV